MFSFSPNSVVHTWGSYGNGKRRARSRWRTEFVAFYVLSCLHVFVFRGDSRTFGLAAILAAAFFVVILVLSGSSTSSMFIFRGNSRVARIVARRFSW